MTGRAFKPTFEQAKELFDIVGHRFADGRTYVQAYIHTPPRINWTFPGVPEPEHYRDNLVTFHLRMIDGENVIIRCGDHIVYQGRRP